MTDLTPATAQDVAGAKMLTSLKESEKLLGIGSEPYNIPELLKNFQTLTEAQIEIGVTKDLRLITDAKNILLRPQILDQIEKNGKFDLTGQIPFENSCIACRGTGELYKFFRKTTGVPCKYCDDGKKVITCRSCKGTGRYKDSSKGYIINVSCLKCDVDEDGKRTGKRTVKCRKCRGRGIFMKLTIDHHIKSTTHCKPCKGRGFISPEPERKKRKEKEADNPVISTDIGKQIKNAVVIPG